jgi:hypothetical protein
VLVETPACPSWDHRRGRVSARHLEAGVRFEVVEVSIGGRGPAGRALVLALSFLHLLGVMLVAESAGSHVDKAYIYFAMAFSLLVEMQLRYRKKRPARGEDGLLHAAHLSHPPGLEELPSARALSVAGFASRALARWRWFASSTECDSVRLTSRLAISTSRW